MKADLEMRWLPKEFFNSRNPITCVIREVVLTPNGKFTDKNLYLELDQTLYKFTVWGENWNKLIKAYGDETDAWKQKSISIMKQEILNGGVQYVITPNK